MSDHIQLKSPPYISIHSTDFPSDASSRHEKSEHYNETPALDNKPPESSIFWRYCVIIFAVLKQSVSYSDRFYGSRVSFKRCP